MDRKEQPELTDLGRAAEKMKDRKGLRDLLGSGEAKRMVELLGDRGSVQAAARAAAAGDPARLMDMMQRLMESKEGAQAVEQLKKRAEQSGLD